MDRPRDLLLVDDDCDGYILFSLVIKSLSLFFDKRIFFSFLITENSLVASLVSLWF